MSRLHRLIFHDASALSTTAIPFGLLQLYLNLAQNGRAQQYHPHSVYIYHRYVPRYLNNHQDVPSNCP